MKFGTLFIALLLAGSTAQAQIPTPTSEAGPWSLDDCIRYAHEHNIQIQQQALQVEQRSVELNTSRHSRLPDLGANLGTNFSFGRSLISNNTYADNNTIYGVYFNHEGETAGLGAEIKDNLKWQQKFQGKKIHKDGVEGIALGVEKDAPASDPNNVDAVTGATLTSDGVDAMLKEGLAKFIK